MCLCCFCSCCYCCCCCCCFLLPRSLGFLRLRSRSKRRSHICACVCVCLLSSLALALSHCALSLLARACALLTFVRELCMLSWTHAFTCALLSALCSPTLTHTLLLSFVLVLGRRACARVEELFIITFNCLDLFKTKTTRTARATTTTICCVLLCTALPAIYRQALHLLFLLFCFAHFVEELALLLLFLLSIVITQLLIRHRLRWPRLWRRRRCCSGICAQLST